MTILDRQVTSKSKEENAQSRQSNQENAARKQRSRQGHSVRERVPALHRSEQVGSEGDFGYWNNVAVPQRLSRLETSQLDSNPALVQVHQRDDTANRGHLKPRGLSKSGSASGTSEELLINMPGMMKEKAHSSSEAKHQQHPVIPKIALISDLNMPTSSYPTKASARPSKKHGDKKVIHKRKHRRSGPHSGKIPKHSTHKPGQAYHLIPAAAVVEECASNAAQSEGQGKLVHQYQAKPLPQKDSLYATVDAVARYKHFSNETPKFICAVTGHHDQYPARSVVPDPQMNQCPPMDVPCDGLNRQEYSEKNAEIVDAKHNSDDEYDQGRMQRLHRGVDFKEVEEEFEAKLKKVRGFIIKPMLEDGACLFRAVAEQVYGDQSMHDEVRKNCMNYMIKNSDYYSNYVTEDFKSYIDRKRDLHTYGNHLEMQAMAELYNRPFEVYQYTTEPINTFQTQHLSANPPIRVSYHQNSHYNAVIDPYKATVGVGLGLPAFKPGMVDKNMLDAALKASSEVWEQQMLNDKVQATDWESTEDAILEQVARESYKEYIEQKSSAHIQEVEAKHSEVKQSPPRKSPTLDAPPKTCISKPVVKEFPKKVTRVQGDGSSDWVAEENEWQVISQVLANSQQEYMDVLKQQAAHSKATCSKYT